jgi:methionyl-tRNA synthetase
MAADKRNILVTIALPYANAPVHIGHFVEHAMTDFWCRFQRMRGHECNIVCADDTHGTPIMVKARELGVTPEKMISDMYDHHVSTLKAFGVEYLEYSSTHTELNKGLAEDFYKSMVDQDLLESKMIDQQYCEHDKMFLPDRFVKGTCPKCKAEDQYGDTCDSCGATYETSEVIKPYCSLCKNPPVTKQTEHIYFKLSEFKDFLKEWIPAHNQTEVSNKLSDFVNDLQNWCISRDEPYFGFEIPGKPGKFFYVWMDAPIGYISTTKKAANEGKIDFDKFWKSEDSELYHVIGKDIIAFHSLFWPVMLKTAGYRTPTKVLVHGFATIDGAKMSKSRGNFIPGHLYLKHLDPLYLRYYLACKLNGGIDDFDISFDDFTSRVNSDLIGKITNVASRGAQMLQKKIDGKMGSLSDEGLDLVKKAQGRAEAIANHFENRDFSKAMVLVREIADEANKYFDDYEPWKLIKEDPEKTREVLTTILNLFRIMAIYLKPVIPEYVEKAGKLFGDGPYTWDSLFTTIENCELSEFSHLAQRMDRKALDKVLDDTKKFLGVSADQPAKEAKKKKEKKKTSDEPPAEIGIEDFMKVDLRVALVKKAEEVKEANKLLKLTLEVGDEQRTVFSGIKSAYKAEDLEGKLVALVYNLKPRKMKFGMSEGMVLAAGNDAGIYLVSPDSGAKPGDRIN